MTRHSLSLIAATTLVCCSFAAQAIPKAAEHEAADVTLSSDVAHPKRQAAANTGKKSTAKAKTSASHKSKQSKPAKPSGKAAPRRK